MKEEEFANVGRGLEASEFGLEDSEELRISTVCVSFDRRGQILEKAAMKVKVVAVLVLRHLGGTEMRKNDRKISRRRTVQKVDGDDLDCGSDEAYAYADEEGGQMEEERGPKERLKVYS